LVANLFYLAYNSNDSSVTIMRVSDIMQKNVDFVTPQTPVRDVSRLIFGHNINGVPVCEKRKVVGFITERDILAQFYPTVSEYMEDPIHAKDFEGMERDVNRILDMPVNLVMHGKPTTISADTPILLAQSLMSVHKIGRLPVINEDGNLVGIISKGDIFKAIVGGNLPLGEEEEFYDWLTNHYDELIDWKKRLKAEMPSLTALLKKHKVEKVLDVAYSTGEHAVALAYEGFDVHGVETSGLMHQVASEKCRNIPNKIGDKINFLVGKYTDVTFELPKNLDAAIFLGNAFPHVTYTDPRILEEVNLKLNPEKAVVIFQIANFEKKLRDSSGLKDFFVKETDMLLEDQHAYLSFYSKKDDSTLMLNIVMLDSIEGRWTLKGLNSTPIHYVQKKEMERLLQKYGFKHISFHGSNSLYEPLFDKPFDLDTSEWMNIVAYR
jgi:CBS domain-containing protein/SAM-dependent methyltransferase